ncbi:MAG: hypothetical protein ABSE93_24600, partial [Terriglobia bacterium]
SVRLPRPLRVRPGIPAEDPPPAIASTPPSPPIPTRPTLTRPYGEARFGCGHRAALCTMSELVKLAAALFEKTCHN